MVVVTPSMRGSARQLVATRWRRSRADSVAGEEGNWEERRARRQKMLQREASQRRSSLRKGGRKGGEREGGSEGEREGVRG